MLEYNEAGWPKVTSRQVVAATTPEEAKLKEALALLRYVQNFVYRTSQAGASLGDAIARIEDVLDVVSDYSHLQAQVAELTDEVDSRDIEIDELAARVLELENASEAEDEEG